MLGHDVVLLDARPKGGGLNEFGIAAYKAVDGFAQAEVDWLLGIGGIAVEYGRALGRDVTLGELAAAYDAVFLGIGLGGVNALDAERRGDGGRAAGGRLHRRAAPGGGPRALPVGRRVVVIGGGMTAIDAGVQSKLLGAEEVTIVYRRGAASGWARAATSRSSRPAPGVRIVCGAVPVGVDGNGAVREVEFAYTEEGRTGCRHRRDLHARRRPGADRDRPAARRAAGRPRDRAAARSR